MIRLVALALFAVVVTACGGTSTPESSNGAAVIGPVILTNADREATVAVGRTVVFNLEDPAAWTIDTASSDGAAVSVTIGEVRDGMVLNPGVTATAPGVIVLTLRHPDGTSFDVTLTIQQP